MRQGSLTSKDAFAFVDLNAGRNVFEASQVDHQLLHYGFALLQSRGRLLKGLVGREVFVHLVHHFEIFRLKFG